MLFLPVRRNVNERRRLQAPAARVGTAVVKTTRPRHILSSDFDGFVLLLDLRQGFRSIIFDARAEVT